jgi:anti-sigma factor RsiW
MMRLRWRRQAARADELSCRELVRLVTDYLEHELPDIDRRRFDEHLSGCDGCANYLQQMRDTIEVVGRLDEDTLDPHARAALLSAFRA